MQKKTGKGKPKEIKKTLGNEFKAMGQRAGDTESPRP